MLPTDLPRAVIPYRRFSLAQQQLADIVAIDYFFAKEMMLNMPVNNQPKNAEVFFHLLLALSESLRQGHSCLPLESVASSHYGFHCGSDHVVTHQGFVFPDINSLITIVSDNNIAPEANYSVVFSNNRLFLRRYYCFEQEILAFINARCLTKDTDSDNNQLSVNSAKACIAKLFPLDKVSANNNNNLAEYDKKAKQYAQHLVTDWQKVAVANALNKSFTIIAGGPGTGKTYTVTKLLAALISLSDKQPLEIALVAPTGKAAQRLAESINSAVTGFAQLIDKKVLSAIPKEAKTIHRLLGVINNDPNFRHNQNNKLSLDILLIDEFSMVDLPLMARIIRALPEKCQLILLGDADQLPSVAAGSVLADLAAYRTTQYSQSNSSYISAVCPDNEQVTAHQHYLDHVTFLLKSRRFDGQGAIGQLAKAVIAGDSEHSWQLLQAAKNQQAKPLRWLDSQKNQSSNSVSTSNYSTTIEANSTFDWLVNLVNNYYLPLKDCENVTQAFELFSQFRVLVATRIGMAGVDVLNQMIDQHINPKKDKTPSRYNQIDTALYHGKPIMITQNHYQLGLYNGDIGFIWRDTQGHLMAVFQQGNTEQANDYLWLLPSRLPNYDSVYAMTIHKTQGSEFDHVAMILPLDSHSHILSRELLYTGITRAKSQLTIQANNSVWFQGVENKVNRHSGINTVKGEK
jgi:exodeoxyribonuclease V alpha subunit